MINLQPIEKVDLQEDGSLDIVNVFQTIQGEGPWSGTPAVFVRTAGCDLQCPRCDSDYTTNRKRYSPQKIFSRINEVRKPATTLVVITGGEPFRQNIIPLITVLINSGWRVQIETNGTLLDSDARRFLTDVDQERVSIVCSPKTTKINHAFGSYGLVHAYKYVLEAGFVDEEDGLPLRVLGMDCRVARPAKEELSWMVKQGRIFVQPMDEQDESKNKQHTEAAVQSCLRFGYRISLQSHKILGLE